MKKRIIAFLLCFAMVLPILPVNAVTVDDVCTCNTETETHAETCALYEAPAPTCSCDAAEGEAHAETCALYVAPASVLACTCEAAEGEAHAETCALYVAPAPTCTCEAAEGEAHAETCALYVAPAPTCTCEAAEGEAHAETCALYVAPAPTCTCEAAEGEAHAETCALYVAPAPTCTCEAAEGEAHAETCALYDANVTTGEASEPTESTSAAVLVEKSTSAEVGITVTGQMPEGVAVSAELAPPKLTFARSVSPMYYFDISLQYADGTEWQPGEDSGVEVAVTFDLASYGFEDGAIVNIYHQHDDEQDTYESLVVINGEVTIITDSFSIYVVQQVGDTNIVDADTIPNNGTYDMVAGGQMMVFYWQRATQPNNVPACIWHVSDPDGAISYTVHESTAGNLNNYRRYAPYIQVTPVKVGEATLTMEYVANNTINRETFTIRVVAPDEFYIADEVAENGCLVPTLRADGNVVSLADATYSWVRSDGQTIRAEALNADGSVNISKDRGGVTNSRIPITYTVTVTDTAGNVYEDIYQVLYGMEILNPGFENPVVPQPAAYDGGAHARFYNGYPGLYWKTTAPGASGNQLTQDVEIVRPSLNAQNYHGVNNPAEGSQYAEVNAEQFGTLYQDMLTTPGAEFTWSFSHAARNGGQNTIYVVVAGTAYAQEIVGYAQIDAILDQVRNRNIPQNGEGYLYTDANNNVYRIWRHTATYNSNPVWNVISGTYTVPEGQYLTRLFFASETSGGDNTQGNLIDGVNAGEQMTYRIEYYPDDELDDTKTQSGNATVYTAVNLVHLQAYLDKHYIVTNATVNGVSYPNDVKDGLYISDYGQSNDKDAVVLKVYLKKQAITVTKKLVIDGWTAMNKDQRDALSEQIVNGYTAEFGLFTGDDQVATASVTITTIPESGEASAVCEFNKTPSGGAFKPELDVEYTVKEISASTINGYRVNTTYGQTATADPVNVKLTSDSPNAEVTCTNTYEVALGSLKITKIVTQKYVKDTVPAADQFTFTVNVNGAGNYTYNVYAVSDTNAGTPLGSGTVTNGGTLTLKGGQYALITDIPVGVYTVTELADDDYTTTKTGDTGSIVGGQTSSAVFTNEYKRHLADLTIKKDGTQPIDENQSYIFTVTGPNNFSMNVVICGDGEVTIKDLPIGNYTVTEVEAWSWRYSASSAVITLSATGENRVEISNTRDASYWLNGCDYKKNIFGPVSAAD